MIELETVCPGCGARNECHLAVTTGKAPVDGDVSICAKCLGVSLYVSGPFGLATRSVGLMDPNPASDPDVIRAVAALRIARNPVEAVRRYRDHER